MKPQHLRLSAFAAALTMLAMHGMAQTSGAAKPKEVIGPVYEIVEPDMLEQIDRSLKAKEKSGELARMQAESIERSRKSIESPTPVAGVGRAKQSAVRYFDPTVVAKVDITDHMGTVVVKAGTSFNPLAIRQLSTNLLFIDARDSEQVDIATKIVAQNTLPTKVILTGGSWVELTKKWQKQVYFDQYGKLVAKLGIQNVPALVRQEGNVLRIDEIAQWLSKGTQ